MADSHQWPNIKLIGDCIVDVVPWIFCLRTCNDQWMALIEINSKNIGRDNIRTFHKTAPLCSPRSITATGTRSNVYILVISGVAWKLDSNHQQRA